MPRDDDVIISVRSLGKAYTIAYAHQRPTTLAEAAIARFRRPLHRPMSETFWALKDVSFDVRRGDVVGVIGRNGAGKSTLFKVLSRITELTTGEVDLYGRVGSLLEVGTGFSGELTGRENIYLNGSILGMRRAEITRRFDEIVDFAGVQRFLDTPVKRYSSGMYVRLAFAVAAHLESEILIIDEVLAVGDTQFQERCLGKMRAIAGAGRTVLFVSHDLNAVEALCTRAIVLAGGQIVAAGSAANMVQEYQAMLSTVVTGVDNRPARVRDRSRSAQIMRVTADPDRPAPDGLKTFRCDLAVDHGRAGPFYVSLHLFNDRGAEVAALDSSMLRNGLVPATSTAVVIRLRSPWLKPGIYRLDGFIHDGAGIVDTFPEACRFQVSAEYGPDANRGVFKQTGGYVAPDFTIAVD